MKTDNKFDWEDMVEVMVESALEGHKCSGKGSLDGMEIPEKALADNLKAFSEACYDCFFAKLLMIDFKS